jgi:hypothetical protein
MGTWSLTHQLGLRVPTPVVGRSGQSSCVFSSIARGRLVIVTVVAAFAFVTVSVEKNGCLYACTVKGLLLLLEIPGVDQ